MLTEFVEIGIVGGETQRGPLRDLLCNRLLTISRVRVRTEKFRWRRSALRSHSLEKINHALRVVTRLVEDHGANCVGLRFVAPGVLHHETLGAHLNSHLP